MSIYECLHVYTHVHRQANTQVWDVDELSSGLVLQRPSPPAYAQGTDTHSWGLSVAVGHTCRYGGFAQGVFTSDCPGHLLYFLAFSRKTPEKYCCCGNMDLWGSMRALLAFEQRTQEDRKGRVWSYFEVLAFDVVSSGTWSKLLALNFWKISNYPLETEK